MRGHAEILMALVCASMTHQKLMYARTACSATIIMVNQESAATVEAMWHRALRPKLVARRTIVVAEEEVVAGVEASALQRVRQSMPKCQKGARGPQLLIRRKDVGQLKTQVF